MLFSPYCELNHEMNYINIMKTVSIFITRKPSTLIKTFYQEKDNVILDDISFKSCLCTCFNISIDIEEKFEDTKRDKKGIRMYNKVKVVILKSN